MAAQPGDVEVAGGPDVEKVDEADDEEERR
jgi:hypothetical protein